MPSKTTSGLTRTSRQAAENCVAYHTRRAMRALSTVYDNALQPLEIRGTQFTLLNAINLMRRPTINQLADALLIDRTTLTRNLRRLEGQALIEIGVGSDKREKQIKLTDNGRQLLKRALPIWRAVHKRVESLLGEERLIRLLDDLQVVEKITDS